MKANYPWDKEQNVGLFCRKAKTFFALKSESGAHTLATELESTLCVRPTRPIKTWDLNPKKSETYGAYCCYGILGYVFDNKLFWNKYF